MPLNGCVDDYFAATSVLYKRELPKTNVGFLLGRLVTVLVFLGVLLLFISAGLGVSREFSQRHRTHVNFSYEGLAGGRAAPDLTYIDRAQQ